MKHPSILVVAMILSFSCEAQLRYNRNANQLRAGGVSATPPVPQARGSFSPRLPGGSEYERFSKSIVFLRCGKGVSRWSGTGFVAREGNAWYIYTNKHIVSNVSNGGLADHIAAYLIDGTGIAIRQGGIQVASDRDLARLRINACSAEGLRLASRAPVKDEPVVILGDSLGEEVITEARGRILGYGPIWVEHNADTAQGNSGSPIICRDGTVIALDTRTQRQLARDGTVLKGSRYKEGRSFGTRINDVQWVTVK